MLGAKFALRRRSLPFVWPLFYAFSLCARHSECVGASFWSEERSSCVKLAGPAGNCYFDRHDGSQDATSNLLKEIKSEFYDLKHREQQGEVEGKWARSSMTILTLSKNRGLPAALNAGLRIASGSLFTWTSSDNVMSQHMLRELVSAAVIFPEIDYFHGDWNIVEPDTSHHEKSQPPPDVYVTTAQHDYRTPKNLLLEWKGSASFLWRRPTNQPVLLFDEGLTGCEDFDLWVRILENSGAKYAVWVSSGSDQPLYTYRMHGGWATLSISGKLRAAVAKMAKQTVQRHRFWSGKTIRGQKSILDPAVLFPSIRMCVNRNECIAHALFLTGNSIVKASDREGLRGALLHGLCQYYEEAIRLGGENFMAARINLAVCYIVAEKWQKASLVARAIFNEMGMCYLPSEITLVTKRPPIPGQRNCSAYGRIKTASSTHSSCKGNSSDDCNPKSARSLYSKHHRFRRHVKTLSQILSTGIAPRWLDLVDMKDLGWRSSKSTNRVIKSTLPELIRLEEELISNYKISTRALKLRSRQNRRVLAVIPSDALIDYEHAGYGAWLQDYYNPLGFFDEVFVMSPLETEERVSHGMYVLPTPSVEKLKSHIMELNVSAVRAYGGYWPASFAVDGRVDGVPVVVSVHDTDPNLLHTEALQKADEIWPVSYAVARSVMYSAQVPAEKIKMFSNRVDMSVFHEQPTISTANNSDSRQIAELASARVSKLGRQFKGKHRVLFIGRRRSQKNWDTVMHSLASLGRDYTGIFIGRGPKEPLLALASELGILQRVHLIDNVPNDELKYYFWLADVFCVPSRWEGFGIVFIEALASSGAVVVTSDIAPMNEFLENEENSLLVKQYENSTALARAITRAATDIELRNKIRTNARPSIVERFGKQYVDRWEIGLYRGVL